MAAPRTKHLIKATFPPGLSGLVASYTIIDTEDARTIGLFGCHEQVCRSQHDSQLIRGLAEADRIEMVKEFLTINNDFVENVFIGAAAGGRIDTVRELLLDKFYAINGAPMLSAFELACTAGHLDVADMINTASKKQHLVFGMWSAIYSYSPVLLEHIADPHYMHARSEIALGDICKNNPHYNIAIAFRGEPADKDGVIRYLIKMGAKVCDHCDRLAVAHLSKPQLASSS